MYSCRGMTPGGVAARRRAPISRNRLTPFSITIDESRLVKWSDSRFFSQSNHCILCNCEKRVQSVYAHKHSANRNAPFRVKRENALNRMETQCAARRFVSESVRWARDGARASLLDARAHARSLTRTHAHNVRARASIVFAPVSSSPSRENAR